MRNAFQVAVSTTHWIKRMLSSVAICALRENVFVVRPSWRFRMDSLWCTYSFCRTISGEEGKGTRGPRVKSEEWGGDKEE